MACGNNWKMLFLFVVVVQHPLTLSNLCNNNLSILTCPKDRKTQPTNWLNRSCLSIVSNVWFSIGFLKLQHFLSNDFPFSQPKICQQVIAQPNSLSKISSTSSQQFHNIFFSREFPRQIFSQPFFLNRVSQLIFFSQQVFFLDYLFSTDIPPQILLNWLFSSWISTKFLNIFSTCFIEKTLRTCSFLQKQAFSQHFLNPFSNICSKLNQQHLLNKIPQPKTSLQLVLQNVECWKGRTRRK